MQGVIHQCGVVATGSSVEGGYKPTVRFAFCLFRFLLYCLSRLEHCIHTVQVLRLVSFFLRPVLEAKGLRTILIPRLLEPGFPDTELTTVCQSSHQPNDIYTTILQADHPLSKPQHNPEEPIHHPHPSHSPFPAQIYPHN